MKKVSRGIVIACLITMLMIIIPSSFASDSNNTDFAIHESDEVIGSGVDVTDGISVDSDNITVNEGEGKIKGTLYYTGSLSGETYYYGGEKAELTYSYTGNDSQQYTGYIWADGDDASFELDLSTLKSLNARDNPYTITISCEDINYEYMCGVLPDPVDISVKVVSGGAKPQVNPALYVAINGSDNNNGSIDSPFASLSKAVSVASTSTKEYDIFVNKGTYTITTPIEVHKLNIIGLGNVIFDMNKSSYCFDASGNFALTNITFINGYSSTSAGAIKSTSTAGKKITITNCSFINCTGSNGGAISTYYGGTSSLNIINSTFINCSAVYYGGAIAVSSSKTADITGSTFINCSAKNGGAVYFANENGNSNLDCCVFINNNASGANNDIQSEGSINANYNYWGSNTKPDSDKISDNVVVDNWVVLNITYDVLNVIVGNKVAFTFDLTKDNTGALLKKAIPEITIDLTTNIGKFDNNTITTNSKATGTYRAINEGSEVITINLPSKEREIKFSVFSDVIYVATNGSDESGSGGKTNPYKTLEKVLSELTDKCNVIYIFNGTYTEKDLEISKNATIIGESRDGVIINANKEGRIFKIDTSNIYVNINSLTLENGIPDYDSDDYTIAGKGGAIYLGSGNLVLSNVNISNSVSTAGGAIANEGAYLTIKNSMFSGNYLDSGESYYEILGGGAIYSDGVLKIMNSTFVNNSVLTGDGGAIYVGSSANIINSTFKNNEAKNGGAIGIDAYDSANVIIAYNIFDSNSANKGGAIFSKMSKLTNISNNEFKLNNASISGGAICAEGLKTNDIIDDNNFTSNSADNGVLYIKDANIHLSNNTMNDKQGSEIFYNSGILNNTNLTYLENSTIVVTGGTTVNLTAVLTDDSNNVITGGNISFTIDGKEIGTAITNNKGIASLTYTTNNTLTTYTISGNFKGSNHVTIKNATLEVSKHYWFINESGYFTLQEAIDASGVNDIIKGVPGTYNINKKIEIGHRYMPIEPWEVIKNITITSINDKPVTLVGGYDGMFGIDVGSNLTLKNLVLTNNNSNSYNAGTIYVQYDVCLNIDNCTFINNSAKNSGAIESWGNLTIKNTIFKNNKATNGIAGAIQQGGSYGKLTIINSTFENNSASNYAGAIYSGLISGNGVNIINTKFINNTANRAGAIFINNDQVNIDNCLFVGNKAIDNGVGFTPIGGAIYDHSAPLTITNSKFINNTADENGGALALGNTVHEHIGTDYVYITIDWTVIKNSTFENNFAGLEGGAIYNGDGVGYTNISDSKFINNFARSTGGAISNHYGFVWINTTDFVGNEATESSIMYMFGNYTSLYIYVANTTITNSKFVNNTGENLFKTENNYCNLNITDSKFNEGDLLVDNAGFVVLINNTVENIHNGLVVKNSNTLTLANNSFNCNGPAIYNTKSILSKTFVIILNNETITCEAGKIINLTAIHTDDNSNIVIPGNVMFNVDNTEINATLNDNGVFSANYAINAIGKYAVSAIYKNMYKEDITYLNGTVIITKTNPNVNITFNNESIAGEPIIVNFEINNDAVGDVVFTIGNITKTATIANGKANVTFMNITPGNHTLNVYYPGNTKYDAFNRNYNLSVIKSTLANLEVKDLEKYFGGKERLEAILTDYFGNPIVNETIIFTINGKDYIRYTNVNGSASMAINLNPDKYHLNIKFNGSEDYDAAIANASVNIKSTTFGQDIVKMFRNSTQYYALFLDSTGKALINTTVKFNINGVMYERKTNGSGIARLNINLNQGSYVITNYNLVTGEENSNNITVKSLLVDNKDLTKYYLNESKYTLKVIGKDGNIAANQEVTFNINGVIYKRTTDDDGIVSLAINLRPGNYRVTAEYEGCRVSNSITVLDTLITKDLSMNYKDGSKFSAQTLDGQGRPLANQNVVFNVNGVFYYKTTGGDGIASLNINLMRGKYIITSMWNNYQVGNNILIK